MTQSVSTHTALWRLLIFRASLSELLLFGSGPALRLPSVEIPAHGRIASNINAQVRALLGIEALSLYSLELGQACFAPLYHVVHAINSPENAPPSARWISLCDVSRNFVEDPSDFAAIEAWLRRSERVPFRAKPAPFEDPSWFLVAEELARESADELSLVLSGRFLQVNASPSFSLLRFATNGKAIWFKAVGEPNHREFELAILLSDRLYGFVPRVLKTKSEWHAWTMLEAHGALLSQVGDQSSWCDAARDLARMQIGSKSITRDLLAHGAKDVRAETLLRGTKQFFEAMRELMDHQTETPPEKLSASELHRLELAVREALVVLAAHGVPDAVGHLDLNPDNIVTEPGQTVFLDWAEACVGHPFLSFFHFLEFFRQQFPGASAAASLVIRRYTEQWEAAGIGPSPPVALASCNLLAIYAHAISSELWRSPQQLQESGFAGYYRGLARRMKKRADALGREFYESAAPPA